MSYRYTYTFLFVSIFNIMHIVIIDKQEGNVCLKSAKINIFRSLFPAFAKMCLCVCVCITRVCKKK